MRQEVWLLRLFGPNMSEYLHEISQEACRVGSALEGLFGASESLEALDIL